MMLWQLLPLGFSSLPLLELPVLLYFLYLLTCNCNCFLCDKRGQVLWLLPSTLILPLVSDQSNFLALLLCLNGVTNCY